MDKFCIQVESPIIIILPRSSSFLIALLAVLKQGGCFVPIDINYPHAYIESIIKAINPRIIITQQGLERWITSFLHESQVVYFDNPAIKKHQTCNLSIKPPLKSLACIIFTSGSTGKPKGVMIPHEQLSNWIVNLFKLMPFNKQEVVAQRASVSFIIALVEILPALLSATPLVFIDDKFNRDPEAFISELNYWRVSRLYLVPSHWVIIISFRTNVNSSPRY